MQSFPQTYHLQADFSLVVILNSIACNFLIGQTMNWNNAEIVCILRIWRRFYVDNFGL